MAYTAEYELYRLLRTQQKLTRQMNQLPYTEITKIKKYQEAIRRVGMHAKIRTDECIITHYYYTQGGSAHETDAMYKMPAN